MVIKKQHYVWRKYLRAWASEEKIWCSRNRTIFKSDLMGVGQERYFYASKRMSDADILFLKSLVSLHNPLLRNNNFEWINFFDQTFRYYDELVKAGLEKEKLDPIFEDIHKDFEEKLHGSIEAGAITYIDALIRKDLSFYETDKGAMEFSFYLSQQYFRTNKIKQNVLKNFKDLKNVNIENILPVMRHIYASNMGWSLFADREKYKLYLLENSTALPFIAGDQPVINMHTVGKLITDNVSDTELYYPVSPSVAVIISSHTKYLNCGRIIPIEVEDVEKYNMAIAERSLNQIYSNSDEILKKYLHLQTPQF